MPIHRTPSRVRLLLRTTEQALTAGHLIQGQELFSLAAALDQREARRLLDARNFTWAPITDVPISRYVEKQDLRGAAAVGDVAKPIAERQCVPESAPLADVLEALSAERVLFVKHREHVTGMLTRADLDQPAVSLLVLGLVTTAESALDTLIDRASSGEVLDHLSAGRRAKVEVIYEHRRQRDVELDVTRCLNLDDRLDLVRKLDLHDQLGFPSKGAVRDWKKRISHVRNCLAHGDTLLTALGDPEDALRAIEDIRSFALTAEAATGSDEALTRYFLRSTITVFADEPLVVYGQDASTTWPFSEHRLMVITAANPGSRRLDEEQNRQRNERLVERLNDFPYEALRCDSGKGEWIEPSVAVLGMPVAEACEMGAAFGQHSVFELTPDRLRVLKCEDEAVLGDVSRT